MKFRGALSIAAMILSLAAFSEAIAAPKRILLLHSLGRDFAPWNEYSRLFREELNRRTAATVDLYEASLVTARFSDEEVTGTFAEYLRSLATNQLDLIVSIGGPAAGFLQKHRQQISPTVPILFTALEQRRAPLSTLTANDTLVAIKINLAGAIANILRVMPETNNIVVVMGNSPIDRYWVGQIREAVQPYMDRTQFTWFNELSFEEMLRRSAALPPRTAIFFGLLSVDAAGVALEQGNAMDRLHAVANAPIFSYVDAYFGRGIVGDSLISVAEVSRQAAIVADRILRGESAGDIKVPAIGFSSPKFDWRELQRWSISEAGLPDGSAVAFRVPTAFERYKWYILGAIAFFLL